MPRSVNDIKRDAQDEQEPADGGDPQSEASEPVEQPKTGSGEATEQSSPNWRQQFAKLPDNFGGLSADGEVTATEEIDSAPDANAEDDPEGYVRPDQIGPRADVLPVSPFVGQTVQQGYRVAEPTPLRGFSSSELDTQVIGTIGGGMAPLDRGLRCPSCGSTIGVFFKDPYTGVVRHQGCSPNIRNQGVPQPARNEPFIPPQQSKPREFNTADAKRGMKPPEETELPPPGDVR